MEIDREKEMAKRIGSAIASRRQGAALTQEVLAELLGIGSEQVSRIERGTVLPTLSRLLDFADALECPVQDLISAGSDRSTEHGLQLAKQLKQLGPKDRELVLHVVNQLVDRLKAA